MDKVIFIDRDGVINVDLIGDYVKRWDEFHFEKGALMALKRLQTAGYKIILISNQAGVGDGVFTEEQMWSIHDQMLEELKKQGVHIHAAYYCLHGKEAGCKCRKPETGLFDQAVKFLTIDRDQTYFIGDKATDIEAGKRFGLKTMFVRTGHGKTDEAKFDHNFSPDKRADNLAEAVKLMIP